MKKTEFVHYMLSKQSEKRVICIDMNSYFASVEQQDHPKLRYKPIIVSGEGKRSIVVAASREAKLYGIKTGMRIFEAIELCPQVIRIAGDGDKYAAIQQAILDILHQHFYCIEVASIDEVFIDPKGIKDWQKLESICRQIKEDFKKELGVYITCSIGISISKTMAKLASNMRKPDGLVVLTPETIKYIIPKTPVEKISGIGSRFTARLHSLGIYTFQDILSYPTEVLLKEFGEYTTMFFIKTAHGIDNHKVIMDPNPAKSFSHEITLPQDITSIKESEKVLYALTQRVVYRMKSKHMKIKSIGIHIRYADFTSVGESHQLESYTDNAFVMYEKIKKLFMRLYNPTQPMRQLGVRAFRTTSTDDTPTELFPSKTEALHNVAFSINRKYGQFTIAPLSVYNTQSLNRKIHGFYRTNV